MSLESLFGVYSLHSVPSISPRPLEISPYSLVVEYTAEVGVSGSERALAKTQKLKQASASSVNSKFHNKLSKLGPTYIDL